VRKLGIKIREVSFKNFGKCLELSNGRMDVVVTTEHGPRVIRVGFIGQENEFCDDSLVSNKTYNDEEWKMRGGHRLWHSPEYFPRTYIADNDPIEWKLIEMALYSRKRVSLGYKSKNLWKLH